MAVYSSELETVLRKFINSSGGKGGDKLRELLKNESVDSRYELLMNVRGVRNSTFTALHAGAVANDLESIRHLCDGFSASQKCDAVQLQAIGTERTALHFAAVAGYTSIINYLLSDLSQQQKYDLLKLKNEYGNTPLHLATIHNYVKTVEAIKSSVALPLLTQLLNIENNEEKTVTDIRPELYNKPTLAISQGNVGLLIMYLYLVKS